MSEHGVRVVSVGGDEPMLVQCLCGRIGALNSGRSQHRRSDSRYGDESTIGNWAITGRYEDGTITLSPIRLSGHIDTNGDDHVRVGDVDMNLHHAWMKQSHDALHADKTPHGHGNGLPPDHDKDAAPPTTHREVTR